MQVESLNDLKKLIKAMRSLGVDKIEIDGIKLELGPVAVSKRKTSKVVETAASYDPSGIDENTPIPLPDIISTDSLTEEQLLNWSSSPGGQSLGPGETI